MLPEPSIYVGRLRHRRFRPVAHEFTYSASMVLLDLDRLEETFRASRLTSLNRFNWASFYDVDHFGDATLPLRERLRRDAAASGLKLPEGPIFLLTQLRYFGYCFNPISLFYCYGSDGAVRMTMAEVNSTFGERVNYWLHAGNQVNQGDPVRPLRHRVSKRLHVSPFMGMNLDYEFVLPMPGDALFAHITNIDGEDRFFDATLTLRRIPWTPANVTRTLLRHPAMTVKTIAAIHFEAARLFLKRAPFFRHPQAAEAASRFAGAHRDS